MPAIFAFPILCHSKLVVSHNRIVVDTYFVRSLKIRVSGCELTSLFMDD